jgi:hypothetical protein
MEIAVQRTAMAFNSRGCGRGRAKDGDGITEEASGRFTKGGHLFYSLSGLVDRVSFDGWKMILWASLYNAQEFIPAMQIRKARLTSANRAFP